MDPLYSGTQISVSGLKKSFGANHVLHRIDLDVQPGEFVTIIGKSGSGKSTLLRLIAGLDTPTAGEVEVDGLVVRGQNRRARVMFQEARLLPWRSVRDNVAIGLRSDRERLADEALDQVGLLNRARDWPAILSGGQRQRVALARALASRPPLLLLDEPLGALDALTRIEMQQLIEQLWLLHRFTAVLITHDVEEAIVLGDRVILIEGGVIAADYPVNHPRPRPRGSASFAALKDQILRRILSEALPAPTSLAADRTLVVAANARYGRL
jgi:sulfonate transport system ATP-binding protein